LGVVFSLEPYRNVDLGTLRYLEHILSAEGERKFGVRASSKN